MVETSKSHIAIRQHVHLHVIPEASHIGADILTPGRTCSACCKDKISGRAFGYTQMCAFSNMSSSDQCSFPAAKASLRIEVLEQRYLRHARDVRVRNAGLG